MSLEWAVSHLGKGLPAFEPGAVWLAGAGPGNDGGLTLDVVSALTQADAVVHDALVSPTALEIATGAELHFAGKRGGKASASQSEITALLIHLARAGKRVLRLKGGDPYVFGRGGEEVLALASAKIPFRVLPGVTSAFGALAALNIPTTMRGLNKAIILATGHAAGTEDDLDWGALAKTGQPIVIYMGLRNLRPITAALLAGGLSAETPAAVVMSATLPEERIVVGRLDSIAGEAEQAGISSPALIIVGSIVAVRAQLAQLALGLPTP